MSIEIRITKELSDYEPKFIGPFTLRKTICIALGGGCCFLMYRFLGKALPKDIVGFLCLIPAAIGCLFGWMKPYGMKPEVFMKTYIVNTILAPQHRPYKTENTDKVVMDVLEEHLGPALDAAEAAALAAAEQTTAAGASALSEENSASCSLPDDEDEEDLLTTKQRGRPRWGRLVLGWKLGKKGGRKKAAPQKKSSGGYTPSPLAMK